MTYDFAAVKARVSIEALFREDGHELKRAGARLRCLSPFNKEKTPSCYVDPQSGRFKCFSSGNSGDVFDYIMLSRGCGRPEAMDYLGRKSGVIAADGRRASLPMVPLRPLEPVPEKVLAPLSGDDLARWHEGVEKLVSSASTLAQIAAWRGFSYGTVLELASNGRIGNPLMSPWLKRQDVEPGDRRVAFPVEAMIDGRVVLVAYHVRLKPAAVTDGSKPRASWRFVPSGVGAWPYILGDAVAARFLVICEGQWDAMAAFDAMEVTYAELLAERVAICAMRGAANWRLFVEHFLLRDGPKRRGTRALVICDADAAGEEWTSPSGDEPGFVEILQAVCDHVYVREPAEGMGKDLNDVWKFLQKEVA